MNARMLSEDHYEVLREIINIGMGQAGAALAKLLDTFVELAVPNVTMIDAHQLTSVVAEVVDDPGEITAIRQAFYNQLHGEALVIYNRQGCRELADLLGYDDEDIDRSDQELLLDVGNILVGACMNGIAEQLNPGHELSFSPPSLFCENMPPDRLFSHHETSWNYALLLKVAFRLEQRAFSSHILIFMPEQSIDYLIQALDKWIEAL
ncbi:MAG: hypothetical protein C4527_04110 [Candidatus Omnitrophota bacterium]|jgi:chemotaxis protein CheC|nr:MAG: hypothetical protein C4527_04110 [Candidatus Omnitrophota bacterium]